MPAPVVEDQRTEENAAAIDDIREKIANGFSFVRSREIANSIASITMEECIAQAVVEIEDDRSDIRPGRLNKIKNMKESVIGAIDQALQMEPDAFRHDDQGSANTEEEAEE